MKLLINGYTVTEHIQLVRNVEYDLKREIKILDNLLNHIKKNKRLYFKLVTIVAMMLLSGYINPIFATNVDQAIAKINSFGEQMLSLVRAVASWTVLLSTSVNCIKKALTGERRDIGGEVTKGIMIMAVIYFLPELFDMMKSLIE